jgi:DNA-binding transcriptional ArsR family regulator
MTASVPQPGRDQGPQFEAAIEMLSDEYACRILTTLRDGPMPAVELANRGNMSRPTVYRRLNQLETAGFVRSQLQDEPDGNARKYFQLVFDEVRLEIGESGIDGQMSLTGHQQSSSATEPGEYSG